MAYGTAAGTANWLFVTQRTFLLLNQMPRTPIPGPHQPSHVPRARIKRMRDRYHKHLGLVLRHAIWLALIQACENASASIHGWKLCHPQLT